MELPGYRNAERSSSSVYRKEGSLFSAHESCIMRASWPQSPRNVEIPGRAERSTTFRLTFAHICPLPKMIEQKLERTQILQVEKVHIYCKLLLDECEEGHGSHRVPLPSGIAAARA